MHTYSVNCVLLVEQVIANAADHLSEIDFDVLYKSNIRSKISELVLYFTPTQNAAFFISADILKIHIIINKININI